MSLTKVIYLKIYQVDINKHITRMFIYVNLLCLFNVCLFQLDEFLNI